MRQKKRGIKIYHLNIGQPDIETPKVFMEAVKKADVEVLAVCRLEWLGTSPREYLEVL